MHVEFYILSESRSFVEKPKSSEFEVPYNDMIQLENAGIKTPIMGMISHIQELWWFKIRVQGNVFGAKNN